jgi:hypothetical protein
MWVRERSGRPLRVWTFQSPKRGSPNPGMEYLYSPFPLLAVMTKTQTSRIVRVWIPTIKTQSQWLSEWPVGPGGLSTRTLRTVRQGLTDRPRVGHRPSAWSSWAAHGSVWFEVNFGLSALDPRTVRSEVIFSQKTFPKTSDFKKTSKARGPSAPRARLSAPQLKSDFSQDFQRNPFIKWNRHSSKCNACKFLIKVALWKVKPMKLIPLDSTAIYHINPVICHPLIALWPAKNKNPSFYLCLELLSNTWHTRHPCAYLMSSSFHRTNLLLYLK